MKCPTCTEVDLVMADRQGVEIDYCPSCRGVWLDRGELEKIIERSSMVESPGRGSVPYPQPDYHDDHGRHGDDHHGGGFFGGKHSDHHGRRKSWLGELFD